MKMLGREGANRSSLSSTISTRPLPSFSPNSFLAHQPVNSPRSPNLLLRALFLPSQPPLSLPFPKSSRAASLLPLPSLPSSPSLQPTSAPVPFRDGSPNHPYVDDQASVAFSRVHHQTHRIQTSRSSLWNHHQDWRKPKVEDFDHPLKDRPQEDTQSE